MKARLSLMALFVVHASAGVFAGLDDWVIIQITDNSYDDRYPSIAGDKVVWEGWDGTVDNDDEIFFYDGVNPATQLTNNPYADENAYISGSRAVWVARDDSVMTDYEIFTFDGQNVMQITVNSTEDFFGVISDSHVAWLSIENLQNPDYKIVVYDGTDITQLAFTNTETNYLRLWGPRVVWQAYDGSDLEIFLAVPRCYPRPLADLDGNCKVNLADITKISLEWLDCNLFIAADCL